MRINVLSHFVLLFCTCVLWCGEPEKTAEAPKADIPQSVRTVLENYDKQVEVEKQKYLTLMEKLQKDLKTKLEAEVKTATQNKKDALVAVLTEKLKELDENKVEVGFLGLGFPGEAKRLAKNELEKILTSTDWIAPKNQGLEKIFSFKKGILTVKVKEKIITEKNGSISEKEQVRQALSSTYLIDAEKSLVIFSAWGQYSLKITEKGLLNYDKETPLLPIKVDLLKN